MTSRTAEEWENIVEKCSGGPVGVELDIIADLAACENRVKDLTERMVRIAERAEKAEAEMKGKTAGLRGVQWPEPVYTAADMREAWVESRDFVARANTSRGVTTVVTHREAMAEARRRWSDKEEK